MYAKGRGVEQDDTEAVKWFRRAADQGIAEAQYTLGLRYVDGQVGRIFSSRQLEPGRYASRNRCAILRGRATIH